MIMQELKDYMVTPITELEHKYKPELPSRVCPLLVIAHDREYEVNDRYRCINEQCALWNSFRNICGLICPREV